MARRALVIVVVICLIAGALWAQVGPTGKTTRARPDLRGTNMVIVEVAPSTTLVNAGTPLTADIVVSGMLLADMGAPSLGAFDLNLSWDPAILAFSSISFGDDLGDEGAGEAITGSTPGAADVDAFEVSLLLPADLNALQPDAFTIYTVTFDTLIAGMTTLDLALNAPLSDELGNPLPSGLIDASVNVDPPAPATQIPTLSQWGLVLLMALLVFIGLGRLRRTSR